MNFIKIFLFAICSLSLFACKEAAIDRCLDNGHAWDYSNDICSDECEENGGKWDDEKKVCSIDEKRSDSRKIGKEP